VGSYELANWNGFGAKVLSRNNWRASLVPAAAVIPAPIVYTNVAAVKKLVVEFLACQAHTALQRRVCYDLFAGHHSGKCFYP
jgi:hypothetical protein